MLAVLSSMLLTACPVQERAPLALDGFALSESEDLSAEAEATSQLGDDASQVQWRSGRCRFQLDGEVDSGRWALCLGTPGMEITCRLNGAPLNMLRDVQVGTSFEASPCFNVPSVLLQAGSNELELDFSGEDGGRGFLAGVAMLYPPQQAQRLGAQLSNPALGAPIRNLRIEASHGAGASLMSRVALRRRGGTRAVALVDLVAAPEDGPRIGTEALAGPGAAGFPRASVRGRIGELDPLNYLQTALAPLSTENPRMALRPWLLGGITFLRKPRGTGSCPMRVHCFPLEGGPLRAVEGETGTLLHNRRFALWFGSSSLLGTPESPLGIALDFAGGAEAGKAGAMMGPSCEYVFFQLAREGSVQDQLAAVLARKEASERQTGAVLQTLARVASPPGCTQAGNSPALLERSYQELDAVEGGWSLDHGNLASARSYWTGSWPCWQFPVTEESILKAALDLDPERASLFATGSERQRLLGTLYVFLRLGRHHDCTGRTELMDDAAVARALAALAWTRDALAQTPAREGDADPSLTHLRWAQVAAHEALRKVLAAAGRAEEAAELTARYQALRRDLTPSAQGGDRPGGVEESSLLEELYAFMLSDLPSEDLEAWALELSSRRPQPAERADLEEVLLVHALYRSGQLDAAGPRLLALDAKLEDLDAVDDGVAGAMLDLLVLGYAGVRLEGGNVVELLPRCSYKQGFVANLRFAGAEVSIRLGVPDVQFSRSLSVQNRGDRELQLRLGVPGFLGGGERVTTGQIKHSLYERTIPSGESLSETVR